MSLGFSIVALMAIFLFAKTINLWRGKMIHVEDDVHIAFLGNSMIECSINDSLIHGACNWARSSELYEFVYVKAKLLKKHNPQIDTLVIGFDNIIPFQNPYGEFSSTLMHPFFYDMFSAEEWCHLFRETGYSYWKNLFVYPFNWEKMNFTDINSSSINLREWKGLGGYFYHTRTESPEILRNGESGGQGEWECPQNVHFFIHRIEDFCNENHICLVFLCAPQFKESLQLDKQSYKNEYEKYYRHIRFIDCMNMEMPDSCFADLNHLNYKGAKIFSAHIDTLLSK